MELRPYQLDAIQQVKDLVNHQGKNAPVIVAPTGAGKTAVATELVGLHIKTGGRVLWLAHRRELIHQASARLRGHGLDVGEVYPGAPYEPEHPVQVASTQTLRARKVSPPASALIVDEAHHYAADQWSELVASYPQALRIGLTATPCRADGRGLSPAFDSMVQVSTIAELTALGFLVPCDVVAPGKPLKSRELAQAPVDAYLRHANGRKTVVFCQFVADAEKFQADFEARGVHAVVVHGKQCIDEREGAIRLHHERGYVLLNCMALTEGWDSPETSVCILARGCGNVSTYLQIVGRVLRPAPAKTSALLIDLTGRAVDKHGYPDEPREYSLEGKGIRRKGETSDKFCMRCGAVYDQYPCDSCGFTLEQAGELTVTLDPLVKFEKKRAENETERAQTLGRWIAEAKAEGWSPWRPYKKYEFVYGSPAPQSIITLARGMSSAITVYNCSACKRKTARLYKGGQCGKCRYKKAA